MTRQKREISNAVKYYHPQLTAGQWFKLKFIEQMANIGSEVERTIKWRDKNKEYSQRAFERALELLDLTISDPKNKSFPRLKELCRLREVLIDYFCFDNQYLSPDDFWRKYFYAFNYATNVGKL